MGASHVACCTPISRYTNEEINMPVITTETVSLLAPHIIELVRGVFRSRKDKELKGASEEQALEILNKDVLELQEVASKHAAAIGEIAQRVEARFSQLEKQLRQQRLVSLAAVVVALIAAGIAWAK
jgi:predicted transcriptional regulator